MSAAALMAGSGVAAGDAPALSVYYFDEPRPMTLDDARVAIRLIAGDGRGVVALEGAPADLLRECGIDGARAERCAVEGWWFAPIDEARRAGRSSLDVVRDAVDATARLGDRAGVRVEFISPVFVDDLGGPMFASPQILARFAEGTTRERVEAILAETGGGTVIEADWGGMAGTYRIDPGSRSGTEVVVSAGALAARPDVVFAEPDMVFTGRSSGIPNEPLFGNCWGLNNTGQFFGGQIDADMNAPEAWDTTFGSSSIITVVIDTGVDQSHPDINQIPGYDTTTDIGNGGGPVNSFDNHGTPVAGCVSAIANNALGTAGSAPGTRVISARTFIATSASGNWTSAASWTVNSLIAAAQNGARVSNNSNYYGFTSSSIASTYASTRTNGMVHFASGGNNGVNSVSYPSSLPTVLAIGALDYTGLLASFSNFGPSLDFVAPGTFIYTTDRAGAPGWTGDDYTYASGTSFASPYAAGVAALLLSVCDGLTAEEVEAKLLAACRDLGVPGRDDTFGQGLIRADDAISGAGMAPCDFVLVAPMNAQPDVGITPVFQWTAGAWADSYAVRVFDESAALVIDEVVSGGTSYATPPGVIFHDRAYTWTVSATNAEGETLAAPTIASFATAPSPCFGDINGDGRTDVVDFNLLASAFRQSVPWGTGADLAENGFVDVGDFNVLAANFKCGN